ncbi:hypothetical protein VTO42DRAFT_126 [Malbranchea cinnamomea]
MMMLLLDYVSTPTFILIIVRCCRMPNCTFPAFGLWCGKLERIGCPAPPIRWVQKPVRVAVHAVRQFYPILFY